MCAATREHVWPLLYYRIHADSFIFISSVLLYEEYSSWLLLIDIHVSHASKYMDKHILIPVYNFLFLQQCKNVQMHWDNIIMCAAFYDIYDNNYFGTSVCSVAQLLLWLCYYFHFHCVLVHTAAQHYFSKCGQCCPSSGMYRAMQAQQPPLLQVHINLPCNGIALIFTKEVII